MIKRVALFYVLTFLFTIVLGGLQEATGFARSWATVTLPQLAPGLAALAMLGLFRRDGLRLSLSLRGVSAWRALGALLAPAAVAAVVFILLRPDVGGQPAPLWLMLPGMALGAFGEEVGWRGYLHRRLDPHLQPLASSALVGVLWALWHVGLYGNGPVYMLCLVLLMVAYSTVLYGLLKGTRFNVWVAAAFHLGINLGNLPFLAVINDTAFMAVNALIWTAVAAVVVIRRRDLFRRQSATASTAGEPAAAPTG